jgi:hypothetical protein
MSTYLLFLKVVAVKPVVCERLNFGDLGSLRPVGFAEVALLCRITSKIELCSGQFDQVSVKSYCKGDGLIQLQALLCRKPKITGVHFVVGVRDAAVTVDFPSSRSRLSTLVGNIKSSQASAFVAVADRRTEMGPTSRALGLFNGVGRLRLGMPPWGHKTPRSSFRVLWLDGIVK